MNLGSGHCPSVGAHSFVHPPKKAGKGGWAGERAGTTSAMGFFTQGCQPEGSRALTLCETLSWCFRAITVPHIVPGVHSSMVGDHQGRPAQVSQP